MIIELLKKYKDFILYAIFGVLTTVVNVLSYWIFAHVFMFNTMQSTVIAWFLAVLFAYITNRKWVFHSEADTRDKVIKEIFSFFSCRIATGVVDWLFMLIGVDLLNINDVFVKTLANVVVILLNFVASKLIVFRHKVNK